MTAKIPYDPALFVGRELLIAKIFKKARSDSRKVIQLSGSKGSGKSWFLCEVARQGETWDPDKLVVCHLVLGQERPNRLACSLYLSPDRTEAAPVEATSQIIEHLAHQLSCTDQLSGGVDKLIGQLLEILQQDGRCLLLLVDGIDELSPSFLAPLENYVLAPLAQQPGSLIVLGGRVRNPSPGGGFVWTSLDLRGAEEVLLLPFEKEETFKQLERLASQRLVKRRKEQEVEEILELGGGYPLSNLILASSWPQISPSLQECADVHLAEVNPSNHDYFWALCVLTEFDEHRMSPLLATWWGKTDLLDLPGCRKIRVEMVATRLARWDSTQGAYVMDKALRKILEEALRSNQKGRWLALHRAAYELYGDWVENDTDPRWKDLRDYHLKQLPPEVLNSGQVTDRTGGM